MNINIESQRIVAACINSKEHVAETLAHELGLLLAAERKAGAVGALNSLEGIIRRSSAGYANACTANDYYSPDIAISDALDVIADAAKEMAAQIESGESKPPAEPEVKP